MRQKLAAAVVRLMLVALTVALLYLFASHDIDQWKICRSVLGHGWLYCVVNMPTK